MTPKQNTFLYLIAILLLLVCGTGNVLCANDISARYAETAAIPRLVARFYDKYQDRLVYGTDMMFGIKTYQFTFRILESSDEHFYAWDRPSYHWPLYGSALNDRILRKVYRDNALKIIGNEKTGVFL